MVDYACKIQIVCIAAHADLSILIKGLAHNALPSTDTPRRHSLFFCTQDKEAIRSAGCPVRRFAILNSKLVEAGLWVFRDGLEGASVNLPVFSSSHSIHHVLQGQCDVMTFRTSDRKPYAGAVEMNQKVMDLTPVHAKDGSLRFYEKNFTSQQVLQMSVKTGSHPKLVVGSASNYLDSVFVYRLRIDAKGRCVPLSFRRIVFFGNTCFWYNFYGFREYAVAKTEEYFFAFNPKSFRPGDIGRFDRSVPPMSCSNDFERLDSAEREVVKAEKEGRCTPPNVFRKYSQVCCSYSSGYEASKNPACVLETIPAYMTHIWAEVCPLKKKFQSGERSPNHRDKRCIEENPGFQFW